MLVENMSVTGRLRHDSRGNVVNTAKVIRTAGTIVTLKHHKSLKISNAIVVFLFSFVFAGHDPPQAEQSRPHFQLELSRFLYLVPLV